MSERPEEAMDFLHGLFMTDHRDCRMYIQETLDYITQLEAKLKEAKAHIEELEAATRWDVETVDLSEELGQRDKRDVDW